MPTETLEKFFTGKRFIVPTYQRDYAWEKEQIDDLFDDIGEALETGTDHYIGTFILSKGEGEQAFRIVDGQQRLTTLTMLLDALIARLPDQRLQNYYTILFLTNEDATRKLQLLGENAQFFNQLLDKQTVEPQSTSQERLKSGYTWIQQRVENLTANNGDNGIRAWIDHIKKLEALEFVEINEGKAIRMFQSVNDRGVLLSNMDKAKSVIIYHSNRFLGGKLDDFVNAEFGHCFSSYSQLKELASASGFAVRNIARKAFTEDDILRYHYLAFDPRPYDSEAGFDFKATSEFVLNEFLKKTLKRLRGVPDKLEAFIKDYVIDLAAFFGSLRELIELTRSSEALFQLFVVLDLSASLYPLTIRLQTRKMLSESITVPSGQWPLLALIEITDIRVYKLRGTNPQRDIFELSRAAQHLSAVEIANRLRDFVQYFMTNELFLNSLATERLYRNLGLYRILTEIERDARTKISGANPLSLAELQAMVAQEQTVEHVLPQEPNFGFPSYGCLTRDEYEQLNDRLGNLTLLAKTENSRCTNRPVEEKINSANMYAASIYYCTRQIAADGAGKVSPFTKTDIENRGREIAKFCVGRWPLWETAAAAVGTASGK